MHVDDRLATVLAVRAAGDNQVRVQYRQLLDLVGTTPADARSDLLDAALLRLAELAQAIPLADRAQALGEPGLRLRNPRLIAELAHDHPRVATAAVSRARLTEEQWLDLLPVLPAAARLSLRERTDLGTRLHQRLAQLGDRPTGLPASEAATAAAAAVEAEETAHPKAPVAPPAPPSPAAEQPAAKPREPADNAPREAPSAQPEPVATTGDGIGAIVRRIAAYRRTRDIGVAANDSPQLPLSPEVAGQPVQAFTFACDSTGRIGSADPAVAGMTVGLLLPSAGDPDSGIEERFARRQPIRLAPVTLQGAPRIAGSWILDATPEFDGAGRFSGYVGKLRRPAAAMASDTAPAPAQGDDRLRQVLHELRTPVNAIQGFAELIQQQLMGPVPHTYRAVAAAIAADAAQMLAGFEELDRLVRLDTGALALPDGTCDLVPVITRVCSQLESYTAPRHSGFVVHPPARPALVQMTGAEAERLLWRLLATCASLAAPGETLDLALGQQAGVIGLELTLPTALAGSADPLEATPPAIAQPVSGSAFGSGFALRLAMAEAAAAGGSLALDGSKALLLLPKAGGSGLTEPVGLSNPDREVSVSTAG